MQIARCRLVLSVSDRSYPAVGRWSKTLDRWHREGLDPDENPADAVGITSEDTLSLKLNLYPLFDIHVLEKNERTLPSSTSTA